MDNNINFLFLKGLEEHVKYAAALISFLQSTGQYRNASTDPMCFATRSVGSGDRPWTIVTLEDDRIVGAVLLREAVKHKIPTSYFFASDATGEEFVLASLPDHEKVLQLCIEAMIQRKPSAVIFLETKVNHSHMSWGDLEYGSAQREVRYRLPIHQTVDETLHEFSTHTKRNLRYYVASARRAGTTFHPTLSQKQRQEAVTSLYSFSDYRISKQGVAAILDAVDRNEDNFAMGLRSATGEWLSLAVGWRDGGTAYVFFLMHHLGYRGASLSTTMRSLIVNYDLERASDELILVGGTGTVIGRSCVPDICHTLLLARPSWRLAVVAKVARYLTPGRPLRLFMEHVNVE